MSEVLPEPELPKHLHASAGLDPRLFGGLRREPWGDFLSAVAATTVELELVETPEEPSS